MRAPERVEDVADDGREEAIGDERESLDVCGRQP
jgi:hypothetical protein